MYTDGQPSKSLRGLADRPQLIDQSTKQPIDFTPLDVTGSMMRVTTNAQLSVGKKLILEETQSEKKFNLVVAGKAEATEANSWKYLLVTEGNGEECLEGIFLGKFDYQSGSLAPRSSQKGASQREVTRAARFDAKLPVRIWAFRSTAPIEMRTVNASKSGILVTSVGSSISPFQVNSFITIELTSVTGTPIRFEALVVRVTTGANGETSYGLKIVEMRRKDIERWFDLLRHSEKTHDFAAA